MLDRATLGDLGHEGAYEGGPGDPPAPVEECPPVHPRLVLDFHAVGGARRRYCRAEVDAVRVQQLERSGGPGGGDTAELDHVLDVVANGLDEDVEVKPRVVDVETHEQDHQSHGEGDVGQALDAVLESRHNRHRGEGRNNPDNGDLRARGVTDAALTGDVIFGQALQTGGQLHHAQAEGRAHPEKSCDDGEGVNKVAHGSEDLVAQ